MNNISLVISLTIVASSIVFAQVNFETAAPQVKTENGDIEGINDSGVRIFKGIRRWETSAGENPSR